MASSATAVPHSPESEKHQEDGSLGSVGDPALLFYGPTCRPAEYKEPEECPPSILKGPKVEKCSKSGEAKLERECKRKREEAKPEKGVKCRERDESVHRECPRLISKTSSSSMVRFMQADNKSAEPKGQMKQVIPIQTITKEVYCNGVMTHREITDCRQITTVGHPSERKVQVRDEGATGGNATVNASVVEKAPKKPKTAVTTPSSELPGKAPEPKKSKSLIPVMNNLMSMMGETEISRLKNGRMREKTTLNSIQGIAQWFLVSQAIAMMVFLVLGIVFVNVFGLLFVVVLFSRR